MLSDTKAHSMMKQLSMMTFVLLSSCKLKCVIQNTLYLNEFGAILLQSRCKLQDVGQSKNQENNKNMPDNFSSLFFQLGFQFSADAPSCDITVCLASANVLFPVPRYIP